LLQRPFGGGPLKFALAIERGIAVDFRGWAEAAMLLFDIGAIRGAIPNQCCRPLLCINCILKIDCFYDRHEKNSCNEDARFGAMLFSDSFTLASQRLNLSHLRLV
jgi:hypothetical protein